VASVVTTEFYTCRLCYHIVLHRNSRLCYHTLLSLEFIYSNILLFSHTIFSEKISLLQLVFVHFISYSFKKQLPKITVRYKGRNKNAAGIESPQGVWYKIAQNLIITQLQNP